MNLISLLAEQQKTYEELMKEAQWYQTMGTIAAAVSVVLLIGGVAWSIASGKKEKRKPRSVQKENENES